MFRRKNFFIFLMVILLLMMTVVGCSKGEEKKADEPKKTTEETGKVDQEGPKEKVDDPKAGPAVDKDTVVIATFSETPSVTTADHNAVAGTYINRLTHNGLFRLNRELNPIPDLLKEFTVEKDDKGNETIWVMKLREGIKFHDGTDLTSDDVLASLEMAKSKPNIATYTKSFVKVEKVDDLTFKIHTDGPSSSLQYDLAHHGNYILPKALIDSGNDFNVNPIGTGPYKLIEWKKTDYIKLEAHPDYFDTERTPKIKNVMWRVIPEGSTRTIALETGEIDYIIELDATSKDIISGNKNLFLIEIPGISHNWLTVNNEVKPFDDINVRKAINIAINKQDVVEVALNGAGIVANAQTPEGMLGFNPEGYEHFDLEKAKEYMKAWGGDPSTITLDMICSNDTKRRAAGVIQSNLAEIGIKATISSMDLATYLSETADGNFTGFIGGYSSSEMMSFLKGVFHSENIGSSNKTRTNNPKLDELITKATQTIDETEREKILMEATKELNEQCYQMPLYQNNRLSARKANLGGTFLWTSGEFAVQEWFWKE